MATKNEITSTEKLLELIRKRGAQPDESEAPVPVKKKLFQRKAKPTARRRSKKIVKVGIDINETDLTIAVVNQLSENRHKLLEIRRVALDAQMKKGSPEFAKLLKGALRELAGKYKDPALWATISSADVETRFLQIPKVPARQMANAVMWAFQKEVSITDAQIFDFHVVESTYADGEQKKNVIAYTAPKNEINDARELFNKAGWPLKGISIVPFAIQNLLKADWLTSSGKNVCTLFIGRDWSRIAIFSRNVLILSRDIKAGARSMVQAILETLDQRSPPTGENMAVALPDEALPLESAEVSRNQTKAEKLFANFLESRPAADGMSPDLKREKLVFGMFKPALDRVIRQVEMTLEHFGLNFDKNPIDNVYISGELSTKKNVATYIGKQLGLQVEPMDPFGNLPDTQATDPSGQTAPAGDLFVPAAGMALSDNETTPNFIFTYVHKNKKAFTKRFNQVANVIFSLLILVAMGVFYFQTQQVSAINKQTRPLEMELAAYSPRLDRNLMAAVTGETVKKMKIHSAAAGYYLPAAVLAEVLEITPDVVKLTSVQAIMGSVAEQKIGKSGKVLNIEGLITGNSRYFERNITEYLVRLKKSPLFEQPMVKEKQILERDGSEVMRFVLSMAII